MSLVETALHKLQHSRQESSKAAPAPEQERNVGRALQRTSAPQALQDLPHAGRINLPRAALRTRGLLPPEQFERSLTNQYRRIKSPLIASALGHDTEAIPQGRSLVVTSAMPTSIGRR